MTVHMHSDDREVSSLLRGVGVRRRTELRHHGGAVEALHHALHGAQAVVASTDRDHPAGRGVML
jgi:hypothetical protein